MDSGKIFWIYQSNKYPTIIAFEKKQPEYLMTGYSEYKCISSNKDLDSYIYFLQHTHDITVKELKTERDELKAKLEKAVEALKEISSCESIVHGDCPSVAEKALKEITSGGWSEIL